ncbi:hypothetical protein ScPMuIL_012950 [Solemya velum]
MSSPTSSEEPEADRTSWNHETTFLLACRSLQQQLRWDSAVAPIASVSSLQPEYRSSQSQEEETETEEDVGSSPDLPSPATPPTSQRKRKRQIDTERT